MDARPTRRIRLIALDVDGTLLDDRKGLPAANREALALVHSRGVHVAIATGRMVPAIEPIADLLGIDCDLIAYNGAKVVTTRADGRRCLLHRPLDPAVAARLLRFSRERDLLLNFYLDDVLYAEDAPSRRKFIEIYSSRTGSQYHFTNLDRFAGIAPTKAILLADPSEHDRLQPGFTEEMAGKAHVTRSDPEYLEFLAAGVDKGSALPVLASRHGITTAEILAMGDADNDVQLLVQAGLGVAVANARETAKAAARAVTRKTNNEGAIAEAVERWVLPGLGA